MGFTGSTGGSENLQEFQVVSTSFQESLLNSISQTNVSCYGGNNGSITPTLGSGATFDGWYVNGNYYSGSLNLTNLPAGEYDLHAHNSVSTVVQPITITQPDQLAFTYTSVNPTCSNANNGQITVNASGGTPGYQYSDDNGVSYQSSNVFSNLWAGIYNVMVKD